MCLYHEDNKTAKQTDIGVLFGVERSTVSKVLRHKEKYLNPDDGSRSPIRRAKGRVPDIGKALSNWARNYQRQGFSLTDEAIREKALFFVSTCGFSEGKSRDLSTKWLERFKQKHRLAGAKSRKNSSDTRSESESPPRLSVHPTGSAVQSSDSASPTTSPTGFASPSPLSPSQSQVNIKQEEFTDSLTDFAGVFHHDNSKSTTSIDTSHSFSTSFTSPSSTLISDSPFTPGSQSRIPSTDSNSSRPRSQTLPHAMVEPCMVPSEDPVDKALPRNVAAQQQPPVSILESPVEKASSPKTTGVDTSNANAIKRNRSNPEIRTKSIYPPTFSKSTTVSPVSSPGSPTQDDARRALELVISYFQHQSTGLGAQEYMAIGKLMERLELAQSQQNMLPGGLTRIDEQDDAAPPPPPSPPHVSKKRSIHDLNWN
ncbi:hypothetical protein PHISP_07273 [Aspergillus sp. HF37]|nr:hypothetical protein PHISP_07273 [Aspergillus sp. HF37]